MQRRWTGDEIERLVRRLWKVLGLDSVFSAVLFHVALEKLKLVLPNFHIRAVPDSEMRGLRAQANSETNAIYVRSSVLAAAMAGCPISRMVIAHEIGHLFMHAGVHSETESFKVRDAIEREARRFAAAFLAPSHKISKCGSIEEIADKFLISREAAAIRWKERDECLRKRRPRRELPASIADFLRSQQAKGYPVGSLNEHSKIARQQEAHETWLREILPRHEVLTKTIAALVTEALLNARIKFHVIEPRTKPLKSALKKIRRKNYFDPASQMTDLSGVQIVLKRQKDVFPVANLIRSLFRIDKKNSIDKTKGLEPDRIGYRAIHFVCSLHRTKSDTPYLGELSDLKFEVQIRTVLQHLWAGLSHPRYKAGKSNRKINLIAAVFELLEDSLDDIDDDDDDNDDEIFH